MRGRSRIAFVLVMALLGLAPGRPAVQASDPAPPVVIAAGVPRHLGESASDDEIFATLAAAGVTVFLPIFQYQESPEPKSLPRDATFFPPCSADNDPFRAMRAHGIQLLIPAEVLYGGGTPVEQGDAMFRDLLACAGPGGTFGVYSVDEPAHDLTNLAAKEALARLIYERSKAIAPELRVLMVHAPIITETLDGETWRPRTEEEAKSELDAIARVSSWSDIVGFDLYVIPAETAKIAVPGAVATPVDWTVAIQAYMTWLTEHVPGKSTLIVLQAFGFADMLGLPPVAEGRQPDRDELLGMACAAIDFGATNIAWYGQSFLDAEDDVLWSDVLAVSGAIRNNPATVCV